MGDDNSDALVEAVRDAYGQRVPLRILGSGSKSFLLPAGNEMHGNVLRTGAHAGIVEYRPEELVVTARAGTPLPELVRALSRHGQMLPFEPPMFSGGGTVGGAVAAGLAGPGRPWWGSVRDALLGVELVNGLGERMRFGGQVMKNVAGYDVSRLQAGAFGTLGLILGASFRIRPRPVAERTCVLELPLADSVATVRRLARQASPLSATFADGRVLRIRLSGAEAAVRSACRRVGGQVMEGDDFWSSLRDHQLAALNVRETLWRISVPPATIPMPEEGLIEWGGALRWAAAQGHDVARRARAAGGWAAPFCAGFALAPTAVDESTRALQLRVKMAFDPEHILNRALLKGRWGGGED